MADKITLSDTQLKSEIINLFINGNSGKTDLIGLLRTKFKFGRDRYFKIYDIALKEWTESHEKAQKELIGTKAVEGLKSGLKSRIEYCLEIQKMLDDNITTETIWDFKAGGPITYTRELTPLERKALYERISKFEGMDAASKSEVLLTKLGKDLADEDYV